MNQGTSLKEVLKGYFLGSPSCLTMCITWKFLDSYQLFFSSHIDYIILQSLALDGFHTTLYWMFRISHVGTLYQWKKKISSSLEIVLMRLIWSTVSKVQQSTSRNQSTQWPLTRLGPWWSDYIIVVEITLTSNSDGDRICHVFGDTYTTLPRVSFVNVKPTIARCICKFFFRKI